MDTRQSEKTPTPPAHETDYLYRRIAPLSFEETVADVEAQSTEQGFRVLARHKVQETLAKKGFSRDALVIIEICSAPFARRAFGTNVDLATFMPCRVVDAVAEVV